MTWNVKWLAGQIRGQMSVCRTWNALPNNVEHKVEAIMEPFRSPAKAEVTWEICELTCHDTTHWRSTLGALQQNLIWAKSLPKFRAWNSSSISVNREIKWEAVAGNLYLYLEKNTGCISLKFDLSKFAPPSSETEFPVKSQLTGKSRLSGKWEPSKFADIFTYLKS